MGVNLCCLDVQEEEGHNVSGAANDLAQKEDDGGQPQSSAEVSESTMEEEKDVRG